MKESKQGKVLPAPVSCVVHQDLFERLLRHIRDMPPNQGGEEALRLSSILLEFAAFELAPTLGSAQAGALIETAAHVSRQADLYLEQTENTETRTVELVH